MGSFFRKKSMFYVAVLLFLTACYFVAVHSYKIRKLTMAEQDFSAGLSSFKKHSKPLGLPEIRLAGPAGEVVDLSNYQGRYLILNIWATWCAPCIRELPALQQLKTQLEQESGWAVIAVSIDGERHREALADFTKKYGVEDVAHYWDRENDLQNNLQISGLPMTYIINPQGRILYEIGGEVPWMNEGTLEFLSYANK